MAGIVLPSQRTPGPPSPPSTSQVESSQIESSHQETILQHTTSRRDDTSEHAFSSQHNISAQEETPTQFDSPDLTRQPTHSPPPSLISPAFTPPTTPGTTTPRSLDPFGSGAAESDTPSRRTSAQLNGSAHIRENSRDNAIKSSRNSRPDPAPRWAHHPPRSEPVDTTTSHPPHISQPQLLERLPQVECIVRARIPTTAGGEMFLHLYQNDLDSKEHLAIVFGERIRSQSLDRPRSGETEMDRMVRGAYVGKLHPGRTSSRADANIELLSKAENGISAASTQPADSEKSSSEEAATSEQWPRGTLAPLVRIHSECYTGETAWSARCDCGEQLDEAARLMSGGDGVIVYLRQEGRGIGLSEKLKAYNLQDLGSDTVEANLRLRHPADARHYGLATAILMDLGLDGPRGIRLLTNNMDKVRAVEGPARQVRVRERVAMIPLAWRTGGRRGVQGSEVERYLETKIGKMGHVIQ